MPATNLGGKTDFCHLQAGPHSETWLVTVSQQRRHHLTRDFARVVDADLWLQALWECLDELENLLVLNSPSFGLSANTFMAT